MNIVFINPKFHPIVGGGETYLFDLATLLMNAGHDVTILTAPHKDRNQRSYPFMVRHIPGLSDEAPLPNRAAPGLYRALKQLRPDVLHVHGYMSYWLLMPFLNELDDVVKVLSIHSTPKLAKRIFGTFSDYDAEVAFARFILEHPSITAVCVGSQYYAESLKLIAPSAPIRVLPFFVRVERFPFVSERSGHIILFPSRILERKGVFEAIYMLDGLPSHFRLSLPAFDRSLPDTVHARAQDLIDSLGLAERIDIPEQPVKYEDMQPYYTQALVTIMPSHYEGFGIALIESMASGTPVVASDIPGINEVVIHGLSGLLVPPYSPEELRTAVSKLADGDGDIRAEIADAALSRVRSVYSPDIHLTELMNVYSEGVYA